MNADTVPVEWQAKWIEPVEADNSPEVQRPAYHLVGEVTVDRTVASAVFSATAHGLYEAFINGERVGDLELTPGFTAYRSRLQVHQFDLTGHLVVGTNAIGALLSDGWWRGQHGVIREINAYGPNTAFLAQLDVAFVDGSRQTFGTDASWRSTSSHIVRADLIAGEVHDFTQRVPRWSSPGADRSQWSAVVVVDRDVDHDVDHLVAPIGPPVRCIEALAARSVTRAASGRQIVDFGQNINGWVRLHDLGPAGTALTLIHGEALVNGDVTVENIRHAMANTDRDVSFQTDIVVSAGDGSVFEPRHSTKGFRYVAIDGHPNAVDPGDIEAVVVHTDLQRVGSFSCSDSDVMRLHDAAVWSLRGNVCGLPTDCPTRERSGWVGDWQLYVATAAELYDVTDFSIGWLRDLAADQLPDGRVTSIVPDPSPGAPMWRGMHGSAGWGDAAVHVPWQLYWATGRTDFIAEQLDSMRRWVDFAARRAATGRHATRVERNADPLPHEQFVWDTGWHFGEWLVPGDDIVNLVGRLATDDHGIVATAYLHRSAHELSQLAALVGQDDVACTYCALAADVLDAWRTEFITADGGVASDRQADLVRAVVFGLVPDDLVQRTVDDLVALVRSAGSHLGTGFLATPFLLPALADHGYLDLAYEVLFQRTSPSWLSMIDRDATTIWEDWNGVGDDGSVTHSLNHYSKGAVISFLHRYTAGLRPTSPGWATVTISPQPGGGVTAASMSHDAPAGRIATAWQIADGVGTIEVTLPPGVVADLALPDGRTDALTHGQHTRTWRAGQATGTP